MTIADLFDKYLQPIFTQAARPNLQVVKHPETQEEHVFLFDPKENTYDEVVPQQRPRRVAPAFITVPSLADYLKNGAPLGFDSEATVIYVSEHGVVAVRDERDPIRLDFASVPFRYESPTSGDMIPWESWRAELAKLADTSFRLKAFRQLVGVHAKRSETAAQLLAALTDLKIDKAASIEYTEEGPFQRLVMISGAKNQRTDVRFPNEIALKLRCGERGYPTDIHFRVAFDSNMGGGDGWQLICEEDLVALREALVRGIIFDLKQRLNVPDTAPGAGDGVQWLVVEGWPTGSKGATAVSPF